jgi:hypothetical protein
MNFVIYSDVSGEHQAKNFIESLILQKIKPENLFYYTMILIYMHDSFNFKARANCISSHDKSYFSALEVLFQITSMTYLKTRALLQCTNVRIFF